jgi:hypothetical protein
MVSDDIAVSNCALLILCSALGVRLNASTSFAFEQRAFSKRQMVEVLMNLPKPVALSGRTSGSQVEVTASEIEIAHKNDWQSWSPFSRRPRTAVGQYVLFLGCGRPVRLSGQGIEALLSNFRITALGMSISGSLPSKRQRDKDVVWVIRVGTPPDVEYFSSEAKAFDRMRMLGLDHP